MPVGWRSKGAFLRGALFALGLAWLPLQVSAQCPTQATDEQVQVSHVVDGDTVALGDGRRLRLIGVDTPEIGRDGQPHQPMALAARDALRRLLFSQQQTLELKFDVERKDRYGRLLAHAFLQDGRSVSEWLLDQGLGMWITVPPNIAQLACYRRAEDRARAAGRGIWALPDYQPLASVGADLRQRGLRLVHGRVSHVGESQHSFWLNLAGRVVIRIPREDWNYFGAMVLKDWVGREVEARGWTYARKGKLNLVLRHPAALRETGALDTPSHATSGSTATVPLNME